MYASFCILIFDFYTNYYYGPMSPDLRIPALAPNCVTTEEAFAVPNWIAFAISPLRIYSDTNPDPKASPAPVRSTTGESGMPAV